MKAWPALLVALAAVGGCSMSASTIGVDVYPDGTGKVEVSQIVVNDPNDQRVWFTGGDAASTTRFRLEGQSATFGKLEALDVGGIRYAMKVDMEVTATIPLTAEAPWYKNLGLTPEQLASWEAAVARQKEKDKAKDRESALGPDFFEIPSAVFKLKLPGNVTTTALVGMEPPAGWQLTQKEREANLVVPLKDVLAGKHPTVTWRVTCGPPTEEGKKAWRELQAERK